MALPTNTFIVDFWPPELQVSISVVISHSACGTVSQQPEERNTTVMHFCVNQSSRKK